MKSDADELHAAHARIRELEDRKHGRVRTAPPPRMPAARIAGFFGSFLAIFGIGVFEVAMLTPRPAQRHVAADVPSPPRPNLRGSLVFAPGPLYKHEGPSLLDIDGDGVRELVVVGWRAGHPREPVSVVALDRKRYEPIWDAGPFPAKWRDPRGGFDFATSGRVIFFDGHGEAHGIDARTGAPIGLPLLFERPLHPERCPVDRSVPCTTDTSDAEKRALPRRLRDAYYVADLVSGDRSEVLTLVTPDAGTTIAVGWSIDGDTPRVKWAEPLVPGARREESDPTASPNTWTALEDGRVMHVYQDASGPYRLAARHAGTGALQYDVAVPDLPNGSVIDGISADRGDLFVVANESIAVIDAATGALTRRIERF